MHQQDQYTYRTFWSEEDQECVGLCTEFPGLSWFSDTPEEAFAGIRVRVAEVVREMEAAGERIPQPLSSKCYSGKFHVRVTPERHRALALQAAEAGVSLSRYVSDILSR